MKRPEPRYRTFACEIGMTKQEEEIVSKMKRAMDEERFFEPIRRALEQETSSSNNNINHCSKHGVSYTNAKECPFCLSMNTKAA